MGLKIRGPQGHGGSSPPPGTKPILLKEFDVRWIFQNHVCTCSAPYLSLSKSKYDGCERVAKNESALLPSLATASIKSTAPCLFSPAYQPSPILEARGHFGSTVGRDETAIREYIRNPEVEDNRLDQLRMWK